MLQISAPIHDTLRPDWLDGSCENRNWNIIHYILLSCGHTYVLLALFQECGPMLACRFHCFCIYTLDLCGFIWKLPKPEPARPWSFCFQNCKQVFIHLFCSYFSTTVLSCCSCLNSTWTKWHNFCFTLLIINKNMPLCSSLELEHKGSKWTPVSSIFPVVRNSFVFGPGKLVHKYHTAFHCKLWFTLWQIKFKYSIPQMLQ